LIALLAGICVVNAATPSAALTLDVIRSQPNLSPEGFMGYFRDFEFKLGQTRQAPEAFLASRSGDCDDFACLAADILRERKYTVKLIAVFMPKQTHVVCYVEEIHGYLDYNRRRESCAVQPAGGKLEDVADKVAASFHAPWRCASTFPYEADCPRYGPIVFH
jgi:hypothetical protein